jgi:hypothetical protein
MIWPILRGFPAPVRFLPLIPAFTKDGRIPSTYGIHLGIIHFGVFVNHFLCFEVMERIGGLSDKEKYELKVFLRLLRRIRREAKLTQGQLAKLLGINSR